MISKWAIVPLEVGMLFCNLIQRKNWARFLPNTQLMNLLFYSAILNSIINYKTCLTQWKYYTEKVVVCFNYSIYSMYDTFWLVAWSTHWVRGFTHRPEVGKFQILESQKRPANQTNNVIFKKKKYEQILFSWLNQTITLDVMHSDEVGQVSFYQRVSFMSIGV